MARGFGPRPPGRSAPATWRVQATGHDSGSARSCHGSSSGEDARHRANIVLRFGRRGDRRGIPYGDPHHLRTRYRTAHAGTHRGVSHGQPDRDRDDLGHLRLVAECVLPFGRRVGYSAGQTGLLERHGGNPIPRRVGEIHRGRAQRGRRREPRSGRPVGPISRRSFVRAGRSARCAQTQTSIGNRGGSRGRAGGGIQHSDRRGHVRAGRDHRRSEQPDAWFDPAGRRGRRPRRAWSAGRATRFHPARSGFTGMAGLSRDAHRGGHRRNRRRVVSKICPPRPAVEQGRDPVQTVGTHHGRRHRGVVDRRHRLHLHRPRGGVRTGLRGSVSSPQRTNAMDRRRSLVGRQTGGHGGVLRTRGMRRHFCTHAVLRRHGGRGDGRAHFTGVSVVHRGARDARSGRNVCMPWGGRAGAGDGVADRVRDDPRVRHGAGPDGRRAHQYRDRQTLSYPEFLRRDPGAGRSGNRTRHAPARSAQLAGNRRQPSSQFPPGTSEELGTRGDENLSRGKQSRPLPGGD